MIAARLQYYCPVRDRWYTVSSADYDVGIAAKRSSNSKWTLEVTCEVSCLCGTRHFVNLTPERNQ